MLHVLPAVIGPLAVHAAPLFAVDFAPFDALVDLFVRVIDAINGFTHNYGWSMLVLAFLVRLALFPLALQQFKSVKEMQALQPYMKRLQARYKDNRQKLNEEMMALYRQHGVNPLGGCMPTLVQMPILIAVYYAVQRHTDQFKQASWLWIGSPLSHQYPQFFATDLFHSDKVLLVLYAVSLYVATVLSTTAMDAQQQRMMKMQSLIMSGVLFYWGQGWQSAFVLYWVGLSVLTAAQQWAVMRAPSRIPQFQEETPATLAGFPRTCPECNALLSVTKGNKCQACGARVHKLAPSGNGRAASAQALKGDGAKSKTRGGK